MINEAPSSSSHISGENETRFPILPEGDGFDSHKLVDAEIAHLICSHLEEDQPSWKQLSVTQRNTFFDLFQYSSNLSR
ncbi:hypothetical protein TSUD_187530 [Trifolium subterraneum]|uniref:Uncharacterized protein n=1 Tax=Trifolium subterraneum TaxID=3900 RepID=A0A2Z6PQ60_TRISU|nr:hypothetical protein TSUD_187530 [Trifolium subterraneum]